MVTFIQFSLLEVREAFTRGTPTGTLSLHKQRSIAATDAVMVMPDHAAVPVVAPAAIATIIPTVPLLAPIVAHVTHHVVIASTALVIAMIPHLVMHLTGIHLSRARLIGCLRYPAQVARYSVRVRLGDGRSRREANRKAGNG